jgi:sugar lactone lactonase YvrE
VQLLLDREIQRLSPKYREPFVLCCLEGRTGAEAASRLGLKEGTVWSRLGQARKRLRERLAARGVDLGIVLSAAALAAAPAGAAVSAPLLAATVRCATGRAGAGAVPARVVALAEGVLKAMLPNKLKVATAVLLALAVAGVGAGGLLYRAPAAEPPGANREAVAGAKGPARGEVAAPPRQGSSRKGTSAVPEAAPKPGTVEQPLAVAFAPSGGLAAVGGADREIKVCDARTGKVVRAFPNPKGLRRAVVFSPDGRVFAAGGDDGAVHLWDVRTGKLLRTLPEHLGWVMAATFSPDGKLLASASAPPGGEKGEIRLWDTRTGELKRTWPVDGSASYSLAFAPDGRTLASGEGVLRLRDVETGAVKQTLEPERGKVLYVAFSPDGRALAGGGGHWVRVGDGTQMISAVRVWDLPSGKLRRTITDIGLWLRALAWSPDGKVLATGSSGPIRQKGSLQWVSSEVRLWDARTGELLRTVEGAMGEVWSIAFSPDGRTVLSCDSDEVVLTETLTGLRRATLLTTPHALSRNREKGN